MQMQSFLDMWITQFKLTSHVQVLSSAVVGCTLEEDNQQGVVAGAVGGDNRYEVVGTLSDPQTEKPSWVHDVVVVRLLELCVVTEGSVCKCLIYTISHSIQSSKEEDLLSSLLECDVIVYHLTDSPSQIEQAMWAAQG